MKVGGQILWNVTPVCETSQIYHLMGRPHKKDALEYLLQDQLSPFGSVVEYNPITAKGSAKNPSIWKESLTWIVPRIRSVRGGNLEG